jgi:hypothetical protein
MEELTYEPISRMTKRDMIAALKSEDPNTVLRGLLSAALYSGDGIWAEKLVYKFIDHEDPHVRGNALLSLGHIARIHGTLDRQRAIDVLRVAKHDRHEFVRGQALDSLEDVQHWIKRNGRWIGSGI